MQEYVSNLLERIYYELKNSLESPYDYCQLHELSPGNSRMPDYSSLAVQQLWLLRYLPANLAEYYLAYRHLLQLQFLQPPLNVLSIGAASGVDYIALRFAAAERGRVAYTYDGIDKLVWAYRNGIDDKACHYYQFNALQWPQSRCADYNVITFPKSISHLTAGDFQILQETLAESSFQQERLVLVSSSPTAVRESDWQRLQQVIMTMSKHGFRDCGTLSHHPGEQDISSIIPYTYPDHIYRFVQELSDYCPGYPSCAHRCDINQAPTTNMKQTEYRLVQLARI